MQRMVLEQDAKRRVLVVPTHFYQVNPTGGRCTEIICYVQCHVAVLFFYTTEFCSTTRKDFIRPEEACS